MKVIILFATFLCISQAFAYTAIEHVGYMNSKATSTDCKAPGRQCAGCKEVIWCMENGNGGYDYEIIQQCDVEKSETCLNGNCTTQYNPTCNKPSGNLFTCSDIGMFPDPMNCNIFHLCCQKAKKSKVQTCPNSYYYDAASTYCKFRLPPNGLCPANTVYKCEKVGHVFVNLQNQSIYYVCVLVKDDKGNDVLYPKTRLCPNGKRFIVASSKCM